MGGEDSCRILVASMSKKRGRSTDAKVDEGLDVSFAEGLLFQLASDTDEPQKPPAKRGKSSSAKLPTSAGYNSSHNNGAITDLKGEDDNDSAAAAEDGSTSAALAGPTNGKHPAAIRPSSALRHCDGFDVVRKGSRGRGRQLMVLPGALGLGGGGAGGTAAVKLGTLSTATPGCPVLYVEFPEVRVSGWLVLYVVQRVCYRVRIRRSRLWNLISFFEFWVLFWVLEQTLHQARTLSWSLEEDFFCAQDPRQDEQ